MSLAVNQNNLSPAIVPGVRESDYLPRIKELIEMESEISVKKLLAEIALKSKEVAFKNLNDYLTLLPEHPSDIADKLSQEAKVALLIQNAEIIINNQLLDKEGVAFVAEVTRLENDLEIYDKQLKEIREDLEALQQ